MRDQDLAGLEMIIRGQEAAREANDYDRFYVLDDELHHALCDLSGHEIAWSLSQRAKGHLNRVRRLSLPEPGYLMEMISEHRAVVAAVARRDPDAAEHALRHHLRMVLDAARDPGQHPDYFEASEEEARDHDRVSATLSPTDLRRLYEQMVLIRVFETESERQYKAAKIGGYCHLSSGQEAATVGVVHTMQEHDILVTGYRCHGFALARGVSRRR